MEKNYSSPLTATDSQPQRENLTFSIETDKLSPEVAELAQSIKKLSETLLFHWKNFPIILPDSITEKRANATISDGDEYTGVVQFKDLFVTPAFDELEAVATDESGKLKKLSDVQFTMIRKLGEFEVSSLNFPGHTHRWRLSKMFQKGSDRTRDSLLKDLARSLSLIIIVARDRFCSEFLSLAEAARSWGSGLWNLLDIIIGIPSTSSGDLCHKLHEERMRYLVAELDIKPSLKRELNTYCEYVKTQCRGFPGNKHKTADLRPPPIPYRYQTPKGQDIDLRLFNKDLMNNSMGILSNILDRQAKGWHIQMRTKLIRHYQGQGWTNEEISKKVSQDIMDHYLSKVFMAITTNAELDVLQPGLGDLLVNQAKSVIAMMKAKQNLRKKMDEQKEKLISYLKETYPIKSRINSWMKEQIHAFEREFVRQNLWTVHEEAISMCEEDGLLQTVYFLRRDLNFIKERETVLRKELDRVKAPTQEFTFSTRIWLPHNWIVRKWNFRLKSEIIETVILESEPLHKTSSDANISFSVQKSLERGTSTRYPFWRWWNFLQRTWSYTWNLMYLFGIVIPWCSPVSFRALLWPSSFVPDLDQSQQDGSLFPRETSRTQSLVSRLRALFSNITSSRANFEAAPDTGFLGKSMTRHFNRFWNYVMKGALGSIVIVLVFPALCISSSTLSLAAALLTPVWVPIATLFSHIFFILVWDVDSPRHECVLGKKQADRFAGSAPLGGGQGLLFTMGTRSEKNKFFILFEAVIWNMLIQGCMQPLLAILIGAVACPLASSAVFLFGICSSCLRNFWDTCMFHIVIKTRGRVPSSDGFVARRIAGPGLASNYFFQIHPEQALAALEARIEHDELETWKNQQLAIIEQPIETYKKFVEQCFKPFSASLSERGVYLDLCQETADYVKILNTKVSQREVKLYTGLNPDLQRRIKLPESDLKLTLVYAAKILEEFYPEHIIKPSGLTEQQFWEFRDLEFRDWKGFAAKKLKEIFTPAFLVPLEETDNYFQLKVKHLNIKRYTEMLSSASFHDDLDLVVELHTPEGDVSIQAPYLDVLYFDPRKKQNISSLSTSTPRTQGCARKKSGEPIELDKLEVPLPIPHPANIAIAIYNRENDQDSIDLNDATCQKIVRATKEVPYIDLTELSSIDPSNTELSTPDNATTESMTVTSHLAVQERSLSDDAVSQHCPSTSAACHTPQSDTSEVPFPDSESTLEVRTVYYEVEKDTSCVINVSDDATVLDTALPE